MTYLFAAGLFLLLWSTVVAPWLDGCRRRRAELRRVGGRVRVDAPRFDGPRWPRDRVSPTPHVRSDSDRNGRWK